MKSWRAADQADGSLHFDAYDQLKSLACKMPRKLGKQHEARYGGVTGGHLSHQQIFHLRTYHIMISSSPSSPTP